MKDIIIDTLIDALKLLPFLFIAFLIIELIEHKFSKKSKKIISKSGKYGPVIGSILGIFPQCGFSCIASNFYITRIISLGTLISIYLSTSDEMLPILISNNVSFSIIIKILLIKVFVGMICGVLIDLIYKNKTKEKYDICEEDDCHCEKGILVSSLIHTLKTLLFIMIITFALNILFDVIGSENISKIFMKNSIFAPFLSSLLGLIPNCGASIMITELYLNNILTLGTTVAGLLTGSGVGILILFKSNKNMKENIKILLLVYFIGAISGVIINIIATLL